MVDVLAARATARADDWYRQPGDEPVLNEGLFSEFVRQSLSLDLSDFVAVLELYVCSFSGSCSKSVELKSNCTTKLKAINKQSHHKVMPHNCFGETNRFAS